MPNFPELPTRIYGLGVANTALTVSTPEPVTRDARAYLRAVFVSYSANVNLDVTVTLNSGAGAAYDVRLATITLTAQRWGVYIPDALFPLALGDTIDIAAPAGGAGVTATAQIIMDYEYPTQAGEGGWDYEQVERE